MAVRKGGKEQELLNENRIVIERRSVPFQVQHFAAQTDHNSINLV